MYGGMKGNRKIAILVLVLLVTTILAVSTTSIMTIFAPKLNDTSVPVLPAKLVWEKTYGGSADDRTFYAMAAPDGYLVVGSTRSIVPNTIVGWCLKLNSDGDAVWNRTFLEASGTELRYAISLTDGFLLVGNEFSPSGDVNGYVARIDNEGALIWSKVIGEEKTNKLFSAIPTTDGFVLLGSTSSEGNRNSAWFVRISENGDIMWNRSFENSTDSAARKGVLSPDGDFIVAGYTSSQNGSNYDFLLTKIGADGNMIWNKTYGDQENQKAYSITRSPDGYVMVGDTESAQTNIDAWVVKVDFSGNILWAKTVGGKNADSPSFIVPSDDGGYLVAGFTFSFGAGNRDFWLFKIDDSGRVLWSCTQGDEGYQEAYSVIQTSGNQYVMVGWTDPKGQPGLIGKAQYDIYVIKIQYP